jgi:hypothetical protein
MLHTTERRQANCTGHILSRKLLLNHAIEGKLQETGRRGEDLSSYWMTLRNLPCKRIWTNRRRNYVMAMMMRDDDEDHRATCFGFFS